jgi:hypothetical protein
VRRQQSGRKVSRLVSGHRATTLSDIIINENLKLLQINLARKVDVLFNFPSRSHCTCNRTYGKTAYMTASHKSNSSSVPQGIVDSYSTLPWVL